jgi:hypothetical protein
MSDNEYEEENLDEFMINASSILCGDSTDVEKESIIDTLKDHLSQIFHDQNEMQNIFKILNDVIFSNDDIIDENSKTQKISNKEPFKIYPIIYSFNPKTSYYYLDYFIASLQKSMTEENRQDFTYLSIIFSEVVTAFFSDEKNNKHLIKKNCILEQNKRIKLFDKILNFCNENIKTNSKTEQSFGCLLLTEFIEKCPLVKEDKYLENLFKIISEYLDDRWFECKLDLLNCTISLIFTAESKFKPYANICLFRVLDYLTDSEWMKRKLAINIVYTLVFYCKEEILAVKDNIIDFLNTLKEDSVDEVREVCLQTLKFLEEDDTSGENQKNNENNDNSYDSINNDINKPKNLFNKNKNESNNKNKSTKNNDNFNKMNNKNQKINNNDINDMLAERLQKENELLEKLDENNNNTYNDYNGIELSNTINGISEQLQKIQEDQNKFLNIITNIQQIVDNNFSSLNERIKNLEKKAGINNTNSNIIKMNQSNNNENMLSFNSFNSYGSSNNPHNYREQGEEEDKEIISNRGVEKPQKKIKVINKKEEIYKIEELKKKFRNGKYNEALIESRENDIYLIKLLPLLDKNVIPKVEASLIEDVINRLNKKISIICVGNGRTNINDILGFYIQVIKSRINLKLITQLNIKDTLRFLKVKSNNKLIQSDLNNINTILKGLKV